MSSNVQISLLRAVWASALYHADARHMRYQNPLTDKICNDAFDWLMSKYQENHRKYHNLNHLTFLFGLRKIHAGTSFVRTRRAMFFFFHDAIYNIPSSDNELKSAEKARVYMHGMGFTAQDIDFVYDTIVLSTHTSETSDSMQQELLDADLAILGSDDSIYQKYVQDIRDEYSLVPQDVWNEKRQEFLKYMLDKPKIYQHPLIRIQYEQKARENMLNELMLLKNQS